MFNFDEIVDRRNTGSIKWDFMKAELGVEGDDLLPMWVADMDFRAPQVVLDAIKETIEHGVLGYTREREDYFNTVSRWIKSRHQWDIKNQWIVPGSSLIGSLYMIVRAFTEPGDKVVVQTPVYPPFFKAIESAGCQIANNQLKFVEGRYHMDYEDLEQKFIDGAKMIILCSPHNPVGRVWTEDELKRLGELCIKHDVLMVSDEIHFDLMYKGHKHTILGQISEAVAQQSIILTSPHKTFNIAGMNVSNAIIPNDAIRQTYKETNIKEGAEKPNVLALKAIMAAYGQGEPWLEALLEYLGSNLDYAKAFIDERLPEVKLVEPDGTYLLWLDFRGLGLNREELAELIWGKGKVIINPGEMFGAEGSGFFRMNIGCPMSMLKEGLNRLEKAVKIYRGGKHD